MNITFPHNPDNRYNEKHPGNIIAGDRFEDLDREGNPQVYTALRNAVPLRSSDNYRTTALRDDGKIVSVRLSGSRTMRMMGFVTNAAITLGEVFLPDNDIDPALQARDATDEALADAQQLFNGDEEHTED